MAFKQIKRKAGMRRERQKPSLEKFIVYYEVEQEK